MGVGSSEEDITRVHLRPCPRGHPTPSTMSPSRAGFPAINVVRAQPCGLSHLSFPLLPQSECPVPPSLAGRAQRRGVAVPGTWEGYPLVPLSFRD